MKTKTLLRLALTFLLLAIILGAKDLVPGLLPKTSGYLQKIRAVKREAITKLEISRQAAALYLEMSNDSWKLNGKRVGGGQVEKLLQNILVTTAPEVVAQTDARHRELELTPELSTKVQVAEKIALLIGRANYPGFFVRFDNENTVYLLKDLAVDQVSTDPRDWLDKTVVIVDPAKVKQLTFTQNGQAFSLINKDGKWQTADGKESPKDKTDALFASLANLTADTVVTEAAAAKAYGPGPAMNLLLTFEKASETLGIFKGPDNYLIRRGSDGEEFIISAATLAKILAAPKDLFSL